MVAVMADGVIAQVGSPEDIYLQPKTRFVSTFIGEANVLTGQRMDGTVTLQAGLHFPSAGADGPVRVVVRPEAVALEALHGNAGATLTGTLQDVVFLGPYVKHKIVLGNGEDIISHVPSLDGSSMFAVGSSSQGELESRRTPRHRRLRRLTDVREGGVYRPLLPPFATASG